MTILATLQKTPLSEMGWGYWQYIALAAFFIFLASWRILRYLRRRKKWAALIILLIYGAISGFFVLYAEGLRQPQSIPDPGIPEISPADLPPVPES